MNLLKKIVNLNFSKKKLVLQNNEKFFTSKKKTWKKRENLSNGNAGSTTKRTRRSIRQVVRIQSALCEDELRVKKIVVSVYASRSVRRIANSCVLRITNKQIIVVSSSCK